MPKLSHTSLHALCRKRIAQLHHSLALPNDALERISSIVARNYSSGRFERFAKYRAQTGNRLVAYVDIVIHTFAKEHVLIDLLASGDKATWQTLQDKLKVHARKLASQYRAHEIASQDAPDFAAEVIRVIYEETYPCDVPFQAWVGTILNNRIRTQYTRSANPLHRLGTESLDASPRADKPIGTAFEELLADPHSTATFRRIEFQEWLLALLKHLKSPNQRRVIAWTFLDELSDKTIAKRLGKTKQAVFNLRNRALARLKVIFNKSPERYGW